MAMSRDIRVAWLCSPDDLNKCKDYVFKQTALPMSNWKALEHGPDCSQYIKLEMKKKIFLISSGTRLESIINDIHSSEQLVSIYIYCQKVERYKLLMLNYDKIRGIYDNPINLLDQLCEDITQEALQLQIKNSSISLDRLGSENNHFNLPCLINSVNKSYLLPNIPWCPWQTNTCTKLLPSKGQGTIEIWLKGPITFEICLSNKANMNDQEYAIVLKANSRKVQLGTINRQEKGSVNVRAETTENYEVLQTNSHYWSCYWLTFSSFDRVVQYGIGEVRPKFQIFKEQLAEQDKSLIETISYLHIKINESADMSSVEDLKDKIKIIIGEEPIIFEPPLQIISPEVFSPTSCEKYSCIHGRLLSNPLQSLYQRCLEFNLFDEQFPNFIKAIEFSIENPKGWCHEKLRQKMDRFGRPREEATYLCLLINENKNDFSFIMKIWPSDHYSPIHEYEDTYSVTRVLHGELSVRYYPMLSIHHSQHTIIEQKFEQDSVAWMTPKLNHIYQMKNVRRNKSTCCITIECIRRPLDEQTFTERFTFLTHPESRIENGNYEPDSTYLKFKEIMQNEWTDRN